MSIDVHILKKDIKKLQHELGLAFLDDRTCAILEKSLSDQVKYFLIEKPYIDKDFRSTYYNDFSKRFSPIDRDSVRVHLFKDIVADNEHYLGYFTLRDTSPYNIGRSYIHLEAVCRSSKACYCVTDFKVNIMGYEFKSKAFPWMQQDANISRCAHVAIWEIIRYFSDKYIRYHETTLSQIAEMADNVTSRKVPSSGLTVAQISQVMTKAGFYVDLYFRGNPETSKENEIFERLIYIFIESGLPLICGLKKHPHAISIMGHSLPDVKKLRERCKLYTKNFLNELNGQTRELTIIDSSELIDSFISCDDNVLPYSIIGRSGAGSKYEISEIDVLLAPLYEKMYIGARHLIEYLLLKLEEYLQIRPDPQDCMVRRIFLTSSNSFKKFIAENSKDGKYKRVIGLTMMPKFIWVIEYFNAKRYPQKISHRLLVDSTALNYSPIEKQLINAKLKKDLCCGISCRQFNGTRLSVIDDAAYINNLLEI